MLSCSPGRAPTACLLWLNHRHPEAPRHLHPGLDARRGAHLLQGRGAGVPRGGYVLQNGAEPPARCSPPAPLPYGRSPRAQATQKGSRRSPSPLRQRTVRGRRLPCEGLGCQRWFFGWSFHRRSPARRPQRPLVVYLLALGHARAKDAGYAEGGRVAAPSFALTAPLALQPPPGQPKGPSLRSRTSQPAFITHTAPPAGPRGSGELRRQGQMLAPYLTRVSQVPPTAFSGMLSRPPLRDEAAEPS